jgi:CBS domain-containing protein
MFGTRSSMRSHDDQVELARACEAFDGRDRVAVQQRDLDMLHAGREGVVFGSASFELARASQPSAARVMKVEELMNSAPRTCGPYDSLNRVAQIMWDDARGCVPIVDGARRPIGVLTERDIAMAAYTRGKRLTEISVLETMARRVICCESGGSVAEAEALMRERGLACLPVVDSSGVLMGLLTHDAHVRAAVA